MITRVHALALTRKHAHSRTRARTRTHASSLWVTVNYRFLWSHSTARPPQVIEALRAAFLEYNGGLGSSVLKAALTKELKKMAEAR